jgi:hypothetical protein
MECQIEEAIQLEQKRCKIQEFQQEQKKRMRAVQDSMDENGRSPLFRLFVVTVRGDFLTF